VAIAADTAHSVTLEPARRSRSITLRGREYALVGPTLRDPRLHLAAVITTLQVLGQTVFHFDLSITQILVSVGTCAALEVGIGLARRHVVAWPASAMLTGNGVAFILRVPGTDHGDWWSTNGIWIFAATAAVSLLSKYLIRFRGRHVFNPSNFGLVLCFLLLGPTRANPLDFWWTSMGPALAFALTVIVVGGLLITKRTHMLGVVVAFYVTFVATLAVVAASGHCMIARWHVGPICGADFWTLLVTSPEVLVFLFFMITDPRTAPLGRRARIAYGAGVALVAAFLIAPQRSEWGTKVALLGALAIVCAVRPVLELRLPADDWSMTRRLNVHAIRRVVLGGVGLACIGIPLLAVAGGHARESAFTAAVGAEARHEVVRPNIVVPASAIPPVRIASQKEFANRLTAADAHDIARDVVADLVITGRALRSRDPALAATAGDGKWLIRTQSRIRDAASTRRIVVPSYDFDAMDVAVLKRRRSQALPEVDAIVNGTARLVTYDGARVVATREVAYHRTFVVAVIGGHYLIVDDRAKR
jgi:Na+-translocating ferredoxin:NAD+ oxidoreductase RnfD subunit